jgi:hypothetical protein
MSIANPPPISYFAEPPDAKHHLQTHNEPERLLSQSLPSDRRWVVRGKAPSPPPRGRGGLPTHVPKPVTGQGADGQVPDQRGTLFIFDEPTTGLHFEDVRILLLALRRLVDAGHSVLVVEHHLDVVRNADWVIDLGPGAGDEGGRLVAAGTPDEIARCEASFTGQALNGLAIHTD